MEEHARDILNESNRTISKLQVLSAFFEDELIYKIYLRTQVIHKLFDGNPELDINKLELFHLQFTASLLELLKKIKKANEKNVSLLFEEMRLNKELMNRLNDSIYTEHSFNNDKQRQALKVSQSLRMLFDVLSSGSTEYPFAKNINNFSARFAQDFFYPLPGELLTQLTTFDEAEVYSNAYATIQRKLMGVLKKHDFRIEFFCGLRTGNAVIELYKFLDMDRYFLFYPSRNLFLFFELPEIEGVEWSNTLSRKGKLIRELTDQNDRITATINARKILVPPEVRQLLGDNYKKISDINFLQNISNFDVEANILKAMLNTDSI